MTALMTELKKAAIVMAPSRADKARAWLAAVNWGAVIARTVAPVLGIILFLAPWETLIVFCVWAVIVALTRIVSLGSIVAAILVPVTMFFFNEPLPLTIFGLLAALLVVVRHKDNIIRLMHGKELKVERIKKK